MQISQEVLEFISTKLHVDNVLHDYKDGIIDYRKVHEAIMNLSCN